MSEPDRHDRSWQEQIDADVEASLADMQTIAVIGLSPKPERDSHRVTAYMQRHGYRIIPVNPAAAGTEILGEHVYATLAEARNALPDLEIDTVNVFRRSVDTDQPIADAIAAKQAGVRTVWLQLGIVNPDGLRRARTAGMRAIEDRCLMVEHRRLVPTDRVR
ncbi:MAG: CoA-binding protein [Chloroflexota bacterium]|nr:CoA-binding protein [Chloroflexota bacterium]